MRHQHGQPQHLARPFPSAELIGLQQLVDGDEVALALRHLAALDLQEAVVHPVVGHGRRAVAAARLGDLVLVVREDQVEPAAMNVEAVRQRLRLGRQPVLQLVPQKRIAHRRALDVPAGAAADRKRRAVDRERRVPAGLGVGGFLPQHEIAGVLLVRVDRDPRARLLLVEIALRELAVVGHRRGVEQDFAFRRIGMAAVDERLNQAHHVGAAIGARQHVFGRARLMRRRQAAERGHVLLVLFVGRLGDLADRLVQRKPAGLDLRAIVAQRPRVDLVVHVGDVADIGDAVFAVEMTQQPVEHVEDDRRAGIADMGVVVDRRPADIHAHMVRVDRDEVLLRPRQRVVDPQWVGPVRHRYMSPGLLAGAFFVTVR